MTVKHVGTHVENQEVADAYGKGEVNLVGDYSFEEKTFMCGSKSVHIEHHSEEFPDVSLLFPERTHILDLREDVYQGLAEESELEEALMSDELDGRFNYDKPAAIRTEVGELHWL